MRSPRSEFTVTLAASGLEVAFIDLTCNSILGLIILSIAVKIAFWICVKNVTHFPLNLFNETSFQRLNIHCNLIGC